MKKLVFLFFTFTIFTNFIYASFPVSYALKLKQDTLQTEEIKQYHANLIKMGIDLSDCKCESCRKSNKFFKNDTIQKSRVRELYILSGLILLGVIIWMSVGLTRAYNCLDTGDCPQSSGEKPNSQAPMQLLWMTLLLLISAGIAIKARFIQIRNKINILKDN